MATEMQLFTVASLLRRGRALDHVSSALSLIALLIGLAPLLGVAAQPLTALFCALLLALGLGQKYWALRVALDAELFQQLASRVGQLATHTADLDQALALLKLQPANQPARSWDERSLGALRLLRRQVLWLLAQLLLAVLVVLGLPWLSITG
jgi:phosphatidylglycerophosphate synthase